jgi:tripartite-type tricarboxylate transporter receptor subunit TctC
MRLLTALALVTLAGMNAVCGPNAASAQNYPTRHVRIITAGTGTLADLVARHLAQRLSERWGQPVIVENQPAAGLTIGAKIAANAAPDGYTLLLADSTPLAAAPSLYKNLGYDPAKSFRPITLIARAPTLLAVHPSVAGSNLRDFIDQAKRQSEPILFASAGHGTMVHRAGELLRQLTGLDLLVVQYKGGGPAAMALLSGEAKVTALGIPSLLPQVQAGKVKALAIAAPQRFSGAPDIPTSTEAGLPGFEAEQWAGMVAPAGTPDAIIDKLNRDIAQVLRSNTADMLRAQGAEAQPGTPAEFAAFIAAETQKMKKVIETAGLRID